MPPTVEAPSTVPRGSGLSFAITSTRCSGPDAGYELWWRHIFDDGSYDDLCGDWNEDNSWTGETFPDTCFSSSADPMVWIDDPVVDRHRVSVTVDDAPSLVSMSIWARGWARVGDDWQRPSNWSEPASIAVTAP